MDDLWICKCRYMSNTAICLRCGAERPEPIAQIEEPNTPQPPPKQDDTDAIWDLVIEDMKARDKAGQRKYQTRLTANDGRKNLYDIYQELLDAAVYIRKEIKERYNV